jgi:hypothetical protein
VEALRARFEEGCRQRGAEPTKEIETLLGPGGDLEGFWQRVKTNLQAGKVRMVFVADVIPAELRRIVEFLNGQMDPAEVLAVEIRQFVGQGLKTLVPRVIGQTVEAERKKSATSSGNFRAEAILKALPKRDETPILPHEIKDKLGWNREVSIYRILERLRDKGKILQVFNPGESLENGNNPIGYTLA